MPGADDDLMRERLRSLTHDELVERLVSLSERDDALRLALVAEARAAAGDIDVRAVKKQLTAQLRVTNRSYDRRYARRYAQEANEAVDVLASLLDGGHPAAVVKLAEHCMKRLDTAARNVDDSGGYLQEPVARLKELHQAACAASAPEPTKLARRLLDWELTAGSDWGWFDDAPTRYREVLGDEGLAAYRERLEPAWAQVPPRLPERGRFIGFHDHTRYVVTHLREQLARASGSVDELVDVLARDLSSPYRFVLVADELERAGREREALAWLERGAAAFPPAGDARLRERLLAAYLRDGQEGDAVALVEKAFAADASASVYAELRRVVPADAWTARRPAALEALRQARAHGLNQGRDHAVRAQLAEGDLAGAWEDAREGGCTRPVWLELADASTEHDPDAAVRVYLEETTRELEHADAMSYGRAVDLLSRARETLRNAEREHELAPEIERLRDEHRRRPRLIAMLDEAGLR